MKAPERVLVVCTGNVCRSPVAQLLLVRQLESVGTQVLSAGTEARSGQPSCPTMARHLHQQGVDPTAFSATRLSAGMIQSADLILTAGRSHIDAVVELDPSALRRTATLLEFARWTELAEDLSLAALLRQRGAGFAMGPGMTVDIPDPVGRGEQIHAEVFDQIQRAVETMGPGLRELGGGVAHAG